ncbi:30S ribosomal protein S8 [Rickettsia rickettsii]|uniref:Small ribosomal subunit protein uS8 n=1 Tax=Rickettsia rickettsii (strain Sheila Smith) TaxID=392021 RepID=RS8_RICRS|nr:30S ribosomal protein S8 [Rickettsia rickettsii]A8GT55.1 RecName: Full=Small ribosomal subunit protein uS8; AltName: Full=30S ribosomal protein S8 [Rickettsia rickettsii str. 'Sheila Smith']ABV76580.1 30S ribosomal protein S8 [Rickettsia rickettsii str. 'Sheila Smith']AJG33361.1 30S ribosomal protein S8 [Rickettsia rickettsii str. R]WGQ95171.1 30S ribosomal protein S8 [Rickettsia rickettsii str. 'Sheila Smith']
MSMTDNVADMLTRIRNAYKSKLISVSFPSSKIKTSILDVLQKEGYIKDYITTQKNNISYTEVALKYSVNGDASICEIHRVSKPGKRVYSAIKDLKGYYNNMGIYILSTPYGVMSDREAHIKNVGGEVICKVF